MPEFVGSPKRRGIAWKCLVPKASSTNQWDSWGKDLPKPAPPPESPVKRKRKHLLKSSKPRSYGRKRRRRRSEPKKNEDRITDFNDLDELKMKANDDSIQSKINAAGPAITPQERDVNEPKISDKLEFTTVSVMNTSREGKYLSFEGNDCNAMESRTNRDLTQSLKDLSTETATNIDCSVKSPQDRRVSLITSSMPPKTIKAAIFVSPPTAKKVDNNAIIEPTGQLFHNAVAQKMIKMDGANIEWDGTIAKANHSTPSRNESNKNDEQTKNEAADKSPKFETKLLHGVEASTKSIMKEDKRTDRLVSMYASKLHAKIQPDDGQTGKEDKGCHVKTEKELTKYHYPFTDSLQNISSQKEAPVHEAKIVTYKRSQVLTNVRSVHSVGKEPKNIVSVLGRNSKIISGLNDSDSEEDSVDNVTITTNDAIVPNPPKFLASTQQPVVKYWQSKRRNRIRNSPSLWMTQITTQKTLKATVPVERKPRSRQTLQGEQGLLQLENALAKHQILDRESFQEINRTCFIVQERVPAQLNNNYRRYVSVLEGINLSNSENVLTGHISKNHQWKCSSPRILEVCYDVDSNSKRYNVLLKQLQWDATLLLHLFRSADCRNFFPKPLKVTTSGRSVSLKMQLPSNLIIAGTLLDVFQIQCGSGKGPIPESVVCWLVSQIADILQLLHRNGISHNNLGLDSFILGRCQETKKWMLVVIGLGLNGVACSAMLPKKDRPHFFTHDAFSLAAIIWGFLTSGVPFLFEMDDTVSIDCLRSVEYNLSLRGRKLWTKLLKLLVNEPKSKEDIFIFLATTLKELKEVIFSKSEEQEKFFDIFFENFGTQRGRSSNRDEEDGMFNRLGMTIDQLHLKLNVKGETMIPSSFDSTNSRNKTVVHKPASYSSQQIDKKVEKRSKSNAIIRRRSEPNKIPAQRRHSRRRVLCCGRPNCNVSWPDNGHMWFLVYSWTKTMRGKGDKPLIPANHPMHLVCTKCLERTGASTIDPLGILTDGDKAAIKDWDKYVYFWGTKGEYEAKLDKKVDEFSGEVS